MKYILHVGVLALQGAFIEHEEYLYKAFDFFYKNKSLMELKVIQVRSVDDLTNLDGLILPGGESTTMGKLIDIDQLKQSLESTQMQLWGICAGLILLSNNVLSQKDGGQTTIGGVDITCSRNVYGRQKESFEAKLNLGNSMLDFDDKKTFDGIFIRPPGILSIDEPSVEILATLDYCDKTEVVGVQQNNKILTTFHPELSGDIKWHAYFLKKVIAQYSNIV